MNKLQQIWQELKLQPVISMVTLVGTALSIFLIMTIVMMRQTAIESFAPENNRDRTLYGDGIHLISTDPENQSEQSSSLSYNLAKKLYGDLEGVEQTSYVENYINKAEVRTNTSSPITAYTRATDDKFWRIYDFSLLSGNLYDEALAESGKEIVVITNSLSKKLFGADNAVGKTIFINQSPFEVLGVVKDVSPLATEAFGEVFAPLRARGMIDGDPYFGNIRALLLAEKGYPVEKIKEQVKHRYTMLNKELEEYSKKAAYHETPFNQEIIAENSHGSNTTPDLSQSTRMRYIIFGLLLIIPAINLSSMTHSRLRRRVSEFGIRRAYGCTRGKIILDIILENFLITLAGGAIGLLFSLVFGLIYTDIFINTQLFYNGPQADSVNLSMIFHWSTLGFALLFCFVLNLLSASVPAWMASRINPVEAINETHR